MTTDERLAHLLEHGRGCPRAVQLGGPAAVEAWCTQQELAIEAEVAESEVLAETEAEDAAEAEREDAEEATELGPVAPETEPATDDLADLAAEVGIVSSILERLDGLEDAVEGLQRAVHSLAQPVTAGDPVGDVAAGGEPEPQPEPEPEPEPQPEPEKPKGRKQGAKK